MTPHVGNDGLLKYRMELLEEKEAREIRVHLQTCRKCRSLLERVEDDLRRIKGFDPAVEAVVPLLPAARRGRVQSFLRVAAILAVGFLLGAATSESLRAPLVDVVPQNLITRPPSTSAGQFTVCP